MVPAKRSGVRGGGGFTLVELLIVVTIIGLVAALLAFALAGAMNNALEQKTKVTVRRLHEAMMNRWKTYETRRVVWQQGRSPQGDASPAAAARTRLAAIRELMRMELPQAMGEIMAESTTGIVRPGANRAYKARIDESKDAQGNPSSRSQDFATVANAECLYLILTTRMCEEESIRDSMKDSEIGDVDRDGLPEFIDGWGNPIFFIRWPTGFESDLQPNEVRMNPTDKRNHDPFDPNMVDDKAFRTFPLIYSAGKDQRADIYNKFSSGDMNKPDYDSRQMGEPRDEDGWGHSTDGRIDAGDNIHNHMPL